MRQLTILFLGTLLLAVFQTSAQDFVYTPQNPAFGGNPYNYSWMLSSAQAQDTYKAPETQADLYDYTRDPAQDFAESLNRQILSRLSREIVTRQFGEEALEEGTYILGDYQIEIGNASDGINITIVDNSTGAATTVSVPYF
ncbi:MAG: curli production assembly/transport component CsgF [Bacteroidales bacterium]|nr:curli production assembly/transport component CsgF [Bacteroidales bacterium]